MDRDWAKQRLAYLNSFSIHSRNANECDICTTKEKIRHILLVEVPLRVIENE